MTIPALLEKTDHRILAALPFEDQHSVSVANITSKGFPSRDVRRSLKRLMESGGVVRRWDETGRRFFYSARRVK